MLKRYEACMPYVGGTKLDKHVIGCDLDLGYKEGRQYGQGKSRGQVRDDMMQEEVDRVYKLNSSRLKGDAR